MDLLIDIGNTRIKWAYAQVGQLAAHGDAERGESIPALAARDWLAQPAPTRVIVANVAGKAYAEALTEWTAGHWQQSVEFLQVEPGHGLALAYPEPERLGVDRWLAMLAAQRLSTDAVAVIDAGTAMSVDVITAQGQHLGGIITPGLTLMADSLQQKSSGIQQGLQGMAADKPRLFGNDTLSCIEQGALFAVTGAIEHLLARIEQQTPTALSVIISGGDALRVMTELQRDCRHIPDLVLQGMQIIKGS